MAVKLLKWLIFTVIFSLVPLLFEWIFRLTRTEDTTLLGLMSHGELVLILVPICAASAAELFGSTRAMLWAKVVVGGFSLVLLMLCSAYFAYISAGSAAGQALDAKVIGNVSLIVFGCSLFSNGSCIWLAEADV